MYIYNIYNIYIYIIYNIYIYIYIHTHRQRQLIPSLFNIFLPLPIWKFSSSPRDALDWSLVNESGKEKF